MFSLKQISLFLVVISVYSQIEKQCCQTYDKSSVLCLACPKGYYFKGNNCVLEVEGCQQYSDCLTCSKCRSGFKIIDEKFEGVTVKKCKQQAKYIEIDLNAKQQSNKLYQSFLIADDYMRSFHKQVVKGKVIGAFNKKFENGTQVIEIQYSVNSDGKQKYFRTGMTIVIEKYEFKEVAFQEIPISDLRKNVLNPISPIQLEGCIGTDIQKQEYVEKTLDLRQSINLKVVQSADTITRGSNSNFKKLLSVKIRIYKSKKQVQITYITNEDLSHSYLIDPITRRVISINGKSIYQQKVMAVATPSNNIEQKQQQAQSTAVVSPKIQAKQSSVPKQAVKTVVEKASNQSQIASPVQDKNGIWTKMSTLGYASQNNINLLKDVYFLVIKDLINKKLSGYQDILPTTTFLKNDSEWKIFLMSYSKIQGTRTILTQILSRIKLSNFQPEIVFEHVVGISEVSNNPQSRVYTTKDVSEVMKSSFYISAAVQMIKANSGYKTQNLVSISVNQEDPNVVYFKSVFNISGKVWQVESLTKKKLRIGQVISEKDISPPPVPAAVPVPSPISTPKENNTNIDIDKPNKTNQVLLSNVSNFTQSPAITNQSNCQVFKAIPKPEELLKFSKNSELGANVLNQVGGFAQISEGTAKTDTSFLRAEAFIECTNGKNLKDTQILAVFSKVFGFSIQYKIFYQTPKKTIYLVYAALDRLKSKIYIVNFNAISFGIN